MKKKLNYDYCQAAPVLEWMSQKWGIGRDAPYREIRKGKHPFQRTFPNYSPGFGKSTCVNA